MYWEHIYIINLTALSFSISSVVLYVSNTIPKSFRHCISLATVDPSTPTSSTSTCLNTSSVIFGNPFSNCVHRLASDRADVSSRKCTAMFIWSGLRNFVKHCSQVSFVGVGADAPSCVQVAFSLDEYISGFHIPALLRIPSTCKTLIFLHSSMDVIKTKN